MLDRGSQLALTQEPEPESLIGCQFGRDDLERDGSLGPRFARAVNDAHATPGDHVLNHVTREHGSRRQGGHGRVIAYVEAGAAAVAYAAGADGVVQFETNALDP